MSDADLLEKFRTTRSPEIFSAMVKSQINLAHSVARRSVRDEHLAEDITQAVFMILAEKAAGLPRGTNLAGWIFRTTQYVAANAQRSLAAARAREKQYAKEHPEFAEDAMNDADALASLEKVMGKLAKPDQDALLLKYYHEMSWQEVGASLGISEEAARKRVERSLVKLKHVLPAALAAAAIPLLISSKTVAAAPASLSSAVLANFGSVTAANATTVTLAKGCLHMMKLTHIFHVTLYTVTAAVVTVGAGLLLMLALSSHAKGEAAMPITVAATTEPELSPLDTVRVFADAVKAGDEQMVKNLVDSNTPQEKEVVALQAHMVHQVVVLQDAVTTRFGPKAAKELPPLAGPLSIPNDATEKIDGDTAIVSVSGAPLPLVKVNGAWKMSYHVIGLANLPVTPDVLVRWNKDLTGAVDEVTAAVNAGQTPDVKAVTALLVTKITVVSQKLQASISQPAATQAK